MSLISIPFFKRLQRGGRQALSTGGAPIYAVGDIHGRLDLLDELLGIISADAKALGLAPQIAFLGDYIDRGPNSKGVIERLIAIRRTNVGRMLKGNHEDSALAFLTSSEQGPAWAAFGGLETLRSYGVMVPPRPDEIAWEQVRLQFAKALPSHHLAFLNELDLYAELEHFFFVHAGVRPNVPLDQQTPEDLLWIREPFLDSRKPADKIIVHGHSAVEAPYSGPWRIGVDTGAYATGVLTAVRLLDDQRVFLQTSAAAEATEPF